MKTFASLRLLVFSSVFLRKALRPSCPTAATTKQLDRLWRTCETSLFIPQPLTKWRNSACPASLLHHRLAAESPRCNCFTFMEDFTWVASSWGRTSHCCLERKPSGKGHTSRLPSSCLTPVKLLVFVKKLGLGSFVHWTAITHLGTFFLLTDWAALNCATLQYMREDQYHEHWKWLGSCCNLLFQVSSLEQVVLQH